MWTLHLNIWYTDAAVFHLVWEDFIISHDNIWNGNVNVKPNPVYLFVYLEAHAGLNLYKLSFQMAFLKKQTKKGKGTLRIAKAALYLVDRQNLS